MKKYKNKKQRQLNIDEIVKTEIKFKNKDFINEKDVQTHIFGQIESFIDYFYNDIVLYKYLEYPIIEKRRLSKSKRIDIFVIGKRNHYIIEIKNPTAYCENVYAIGQILDYCSSYENKDKTINILITTSYDVNISRTITEYKLPIDLFYVEKERIMKFIEFANYGSTNWK